MPKVVRFYQNGPAEVLKIEEIPLEEPDSGEVRLKIEAFGLNRSEVQFRRDEYPLLSARFPSRLGKEAVGIIEAVGSGVEGWQIGNRVTTIPCFDMQKYGIYGETAIVPAFALAKYPPNLSSLEATAIWQQYLTAYAPLLEYSPVQPDDYVLITAASSSVGRAAIQVTRNLGATVLATTRTRQKKADLLEGGADYVIVMEEEDLIGRVMELTKGKGVKIIFDPVSGPDVLTLAETAAKGGTIYLYGALSTEPTPFPLVAAMKKGLIIRGYTLWEIIGDPAMLERAKAYIYENLVSGALRPVIDRVFTLDEIVEAHRYMESNQQNGKIVVTCDGLKVRVKF
jgi:NADPH:quinone reductase-like Zn-dependent oxidoreductase